MITGQWSDFVKGVSARVDEIIDETKDLGANFLGYGLHGKQDADGLVFRTQGVTGLNYLELFSEDGSINEDRTYPAYQTEYVMKDHGKIVTVSQKLMKTRPAELEEKLDEIKQLRIAAARTLNKWVWQPLVDAFVATNSNVNFPVSRLGDAVAMVSASHPSKVTGVANRSNLLSGNPVLSETAINLAIVQLKEMLNGRGLPLNYEGKFTLVVPPALHKAAYETLKSQLKADSQNNDINYYQGIFTDLVSPNYIGAANGGSDTAWFVFANEVPANMKALRYVSLIEPKIEYTTDFDTKSMRVSIDMSGAVGYSNFEYVVASSGLGE